MNPNNYPANLDFLSKEEITSIFAAKIQRWARGKDIRRASKKIIRAIQIKFTGYQ